MISKFQGLHWLAFFLLSMIGCSWLLYVRGGIVPSASLFAVAMGCLAWLAILWLGRRSTESFRYEANVRRQHYFQLCFQGSVYIYWGLYWDVVRDWVPYMVAQILVGYAVDALLSWSRKKAWRLGYGPFPIVFSINFFLWFNPEYFYLQLLLIVVTYLSKEFITWTRENKRVHIFNPSAISLAAAGVVLMATHRIGLTTGLDVIESFYIPPNFFEVLFLLSILVQFFFSTTLVTGGAVLSMSACFFAMRLVGLPMITPFDVSVFLGTNLLVTDPSTSPRSKTGKLLFGLTYGLCVFGFFNLLKSLQQPAYFDKILGVMIVNPLAMRFDVLGARLVQAAMAMRRSFQLLGNRYVHMAAYAVLFLAVLPYLKARDPNAVNPYPPQLIRSSPQMRESIAKAMAVDTIYPDMRQPFGFKAELAHFRDLGEIDRDTAEANIRVGHALLALGESDMAIERFQQAIASEPKYSTQLSTVIGTIRARKAGD